MRLLTLATLAFAIQPGWTQELALSSYTLSNGMKLVVHPDHDIPNVAAYFFFKVGSRNEHPGTTGLSHFFEHMMFNGAKKYGPGQLDIQMEKNGARNNAYTSRDVTVYQDWFPRNTSELIFDIEADRIANLSFDPKIIESERGVVYSERRTSVDNDNGGTLVEQVNAATFEAHPYHWPVIGWPSDIEGWTMEDLKSHFSMGYSPNNCVVVVAGDVTPEDVLRLARQYLEPIPSHEPPPPVRTKEPEQLGERRVSVRRPAQLPLLMVSYHVPQSNHADRLPVDLLATILARGRSSRLYRALADQKQLVLDLDASREESIDPGQLLLTLQVREGAQPADVERALYAEIERVRSAGVTAAEVDKARNQLLVQYYRDLRTISGKANLIGQAEVFLGDYRKINTYPQELKAVTAADLLRVAKAYLGESNRTVGTLIPDNKETKK